MTQAARFSPAEPQVAYTTREPAALQSGEQITPGAHGPWTSSLVSLALVAAIVTAGVLFVRRRSRPDQMERIFERLARNTGTDARGCALLRRVARAGGIEHPAVLMLVPSRFKLAIDTGERRGRLKPRDIRAAIALDSRLDWTRTARGPRPEPGMRQSLGGAEGEPSDSSPRSLSAMSV